jgi:HAMP domain-containing protein
MSVRLRILAMSCGFMIIIFTLGALAQRQVTQMGRLAIDIYDHAFMGMSYVDQAQVAFLRLSGAHAGGQPVAAGEVQAVLDQLGVALERAASGRTRTAGEQVAAALRGLPQVPAAELARRLNETGQALTRLVKRYAADGLDARDAAEELASSSQRTVLIQIGIAVACALGLGWGVGRSLSRPLVQLVRVIKGLAAGELELQMAPRLTRRHDEIGELGRAADVFRQAMQQNARAGEERRAIEARAALEKRETMRAAADKIESETRAVTERSLLAGQPCRAARYLRNARAGKRRDGDRGQRHCNGTQPDGGRRGGAIVGVGA